MAVSAVELPRVVRGMSRGAAKPFIRRTGTAWAREMRLSGGRAGCCLAKGDRRIHTPIRHPKQHAQGLITDYVIKSSTANYLPTDAKLT